jgi:plasmid maintenance system antidote protein VapI
MARPRGHRLSPPAWEDALRFAGLTLTQTAACAGIPRATISSLVGGHHRATFREARKIAAALDCRPETLFPSLLPTYAEVA